MKKIIIPFRVKEEVVRGVALQVFIISVIAIIAKSRYLTILLVSDFLIRSVLTPKYSPLVFLSNLFIYKIFKNKMIFFKPKRFAAFIGLLISGTSLLLLFLDKNLIAVILLSLLSIFSMLETFFKFCAGCKIYGILMHLGLLEEDECLDCTFQGGSGI